jgi:signal transduction histidine kinase/sugar lactone lactonase YvrE
LKFLTSFFCLLSLTAYSQDYTTRNYSVEEGLPHSRVVVLHEDSQGYLWVGTYGGGVARFDGRKFESFDESNGLINSVVLGIQEDSNGNIWVCTPLGLSKFDGTTFKNFTGHLERGFFGMDVYEHRDTLYTLLRANEDWRFGIIFQDSIVGKNHRFGIQQPIVNAFAADGNTLYLNLINGDIVEKTHQVKVIASNTRVITFFKSKLGMHALTTTGIFDITSNGLSPRFGGLTADWITIDQDFTYAWIWKNGKLSKFLFSDSGWQEETLTLPFESSFTMIDSEGNSWFGTIGKGLYRFSKSSFTKLNKETNNSAYTFSLDRDSNLWVGTKTGIEIYTPDGILTKKLNFKNAEKDRINSLATGLDGAIWAGTMGGLARIINSGESIEWFTTAQGLNSNAIRSLEIDSLGRIWIGYFYGKGLSIFDSGKNEAITKKDGLLVESVWDLKYSKELQTMFVCTDLGIQGFKNQEFKTLEIHEFKNKILLSLGIYKNQFLLIGSGGAGLAIWDIQAGTYTILTTKDGLASNFIYFSKADPDNFIWVGTVKGIDRVSLNENLEIKSLKHFGSQNGLSPNGVNTNAVLLEKDYQLFGMTDGAYRYLEDKEYNEAKFPLHFVQIRNNNRSIKPQTDSIFSDNENEFEFTFNKVDKQATVLRYQYILENWDRNWISATETNRVVYSNLLPGQYIFKVKAANSEGLWVDEITFPITILAPFYQRLWFKMGIVLTVGLFIFSFFYIRTKWKINQIMVAARAKNEESLRLRKEIGSDFHDEVGNQLARILNYIGLLRMPNYPDKNEILDKAEETSKYLLTGTKDFLWSIDPIHDNLDSVCVHIRDFGEKLLSEKDIEFRFYSDARTNTKLPFGYTRQINLIFKEALTNAFKHSGAEKVALRIHQNATSIDISLEDNGGGLNNQQDESGDGFKNMQMRAAKINGILAISNTTDRGMTVKLSFNLKN